MINVGDNIKTLIQKLLSNLIPDSAQIYNMYQIEQRRQRVNLIAQIADIYPVELCQQLDFNIQQSAKHKMQYL